MSDEAVRKEFEAWFRRKYYTVDPIAEATVWAAWQASRSAAIQECADVVDSHQCRSEYVKTHLRDKLLALKER